MSEDAKAMLTYIGEQYRKLKAAHAAAVNDPTVDREWLMRLNGQVGAVEHIYFYLGRMYVG